MQCQILNMSCLGQKKTITFEFKKSTEWINNHMNMLGINIWFFVLGLVFLPSAMNFILILCFIVFLITIIEYLISCYIRCYKCIQYWDIAKRFIPSVTNSNFLIPSYKRCQKLQGDKSDQWTSYLNLFCPNISFWLPLKTSKNLRIKRRHWEELC